MAVKLLRCSGQWAKIKAHPCWKVEKALQDMGIEYERVNLPSGRGNRDDITAMTGQRKYPALQFEDGSVYREQSKDMAVAIKAGKLDEKRGAASG